MRCSRVQDRLMAYHDGELSASGNRKIEKHLSTCDECTQLLERFVQADQASATAGVPEVTGADDRYWESFTSRVLDRVEEDAATRVPVPEKQSRPFFRMEFPSLVPAMSIALVVVVSAGVLLKVGRVAPVPEAPMVEAPLAKAPITRAEGEGRRAKEAAREPEGEGRKDDTVHSFRQESDSLDVVGPEPIEKTANIQPTEVAPGRLTGKLSSSSIEPVLSKEAAAAVPRQEGEAALPDNVFAGDAPPESAPPVSAAKAELNLKKTAMADGADIQPDGDVSTSLAVVDMPEKKQVPKPAPTEPASPEQTPTEPALEPRPEEVIAPSARKAAVVQPVVAPAVSPVVPPVISEEPEVLTPPAPAAETAFADDPSPDTEGSAAGSAQVEVEEVVGKVLAEIESPPVREQAAAVAAAPPSPPPSRVTSPVPGPEAMESAAAPLPEVEEVVSGYSLKAETVVDDAERSASRPSLYRVPREQLEHARRLAEVRKYWESEQILKDLISQKPPTPVFEEASVLMVDVLSNQNRSVEAQQFLDDAKLQFPSNEMIQQYRLGDPAPVQ